MSMVNMRYMPTPNHEQAITLDMLNGGLNISELDFRLKPNESPQMKNLIWRDGVLCTRFGQEYESIVPLATTLTAYAVYEKPYHGFILAHMGTSLWYHKLDPDIASWATASAGASIPTNPGVFFEYNGILYYKNRGGYYKLTYNSSGQGSITATAVTPYTPVTYINGVARNGTYTEWGGGSAYQPENRLSAYKEVWYNIPAEDADTVDPPSPQKGRYYLPDWNADYDDITVYVNDVLQTRGQDAAYICTKSTNNKYFRVTFNAGHIPQPTDPPTQNQVRIIYKHTNTEAYNSIMSCNLAATYGGTGELCVVMGGCEAQPNAIFWNTIGEGAAMDPRYFPMEQYQLVGSSEEPVTGFGKQQSFLVVFKERSVGRVKQDTVEVDGRVRIDMPYVAINAKIGCDLPKTIQLIDNNLVWCNTEQGVHILKDSSYAYENNIECVSIKVNGSRGKKGLLYAVQHASADMTAGGPCSLDDDKHYWLCVDGKCWVWDYENTSYRDPSWYYFTDIGAIGFCKEVEELWHLNKRGDLTHFIRDPDNVNRFTDYGEMIEKSYRFATQAFGGYDRLKNVNSIIVTVRHDTNNHTRVTYITDYEVRVDRTDLMCFRPWRLVPRNLAYRNLDPTTIGTNVFRRRPMCRRVKHFTVQLDSITPSSDPLDPTYGMTVNQDLSIVSMQIFFNYQGRLR